MAKPVYLAIRLLAISIVFLAFAGAEPAYAFNQDWGGAEDDWSMPTPTSGSAPTVLTCAARARDRQRCRECATVIKADGTESKYPSCVGVAWSAACRCENANTAACRAMGVCDYWP